MYQFTVRNNLQFFNLQNYNYFLFVVILYEKKINMITCVYCRTVVNDVSLHQRFLFWHLLFGAVADGLRNVSPSCCIGEKMNGYCPKS